MIKFFLSSWVCLILLVGASIANSEYAVLPDSFPNVDTPRELAEAWLRFHEADLCQGIDTVFVFTKDGVEVRSQVEDQKSYEKLEELFAPLRNSWKIDLQATRPQEKPKSDEEHEEREPPASLWENYELRSFMGDPVARFRERPGFEADTDTIPPPADPMLRQRLILFADQTLAWNRKVDRYAKDIPELTRVALDPALPSSLRSRARAVCVAHVQNLDRYVGKLNANLEHAFPRVRKKEQSAGPGKPGMVLNTPVQRADYLAESAGSVVERVYRFIHPEQYTVGIEELRQPPLLESLKAFRKIISDFQSSLAKGNP